MLRTSNSHPSQTSPTRVHTPKHTSGPKQRGGVSQPLPMCTDQRARATKGRCVPLRCPDRQTDREKDVHAFGCSPSGGGAQPAGQGGYRGSPWHAQTEGGSSGAAEERGPPAWHDRGGARGR